MGLDMYLYAEKQIDQYEYLDMPSGQVSRRDNLEYDRANQFLSELPVGEYGGITITKCVAYWRKANAVHGWIVRNLANDEDTCQRIPVSRDDLLSLREACLKGLNGRNNAVIGKENFDGSERSFDQLAEDIVKTINQEVRKSLESTIATDDDPIPPTAGFFFGGTEKDEYYYSYLAETVETINCILAGDPKGVYEYYYQASW